MSRYIPCITHVQLKQFRCFADMQCSLDAPFVYISGPNGSGKSALIEALHYACYVRSFRTSSLRDLSSHATDSFFIKLHIQGDQQGAPHQIQIGSYGDKRLIKINEKRIDTYKDLMAYYRAITITADSLRLIQEAPIERRAFLDGAISLHNAGYIERLRAYYAVLEARNALLHNPKVQQEIYTILTDQLWQKAVDIQAYRIDFLNRLSHKIQELIARYIDEPLQISMNYIPKRMNLGASYHDFLVTNQRLQNDEMRLQRSLFGPHLDDIEIIFKNNSSRHFASRGQQKLIVLLIQAAHCHLLPPSIGSTVLLIDDFLTDFDQKRIELLLRLLADLPAQCIVTSPALDQYFCDTAKVLFSSTISLQLP